MVYSPVCLVLWRLRSKVRVKREDERVEIRWKLWLREKAILVWASLMEVALMVGEIVGTE